MSALVTRLDGGWSVVVEPATELVTVGGKTDNGVRVGGASVTRASGKFEVYLISADGQTRIPPGRNLTDAAMVDAERARLVRNFDAVRIEVRADLATGPAMAGHDGRLAELEKFYVDVAYATGIVYQADGHNDEPGPMSAIVAQTRENAELVGQLFLELSELKQRMFTMSEAVRGGTAHTDAVAQSIAADVLRKDWRGLFPPSEDKS